MDLKLHEREECVPIRVQFVSGVSALVLLRPCVLLAAAAKRGLSGRGAFALCAKFQVPSCREGVRCWFETARGVPDSRCRRLSESNLRFGAEVVARYGDNVAYLSCMRNENNTAWDLERDGYTKGREVLLDAMCLAKSNFLLYSHSGVPEFALRLNVALHERSINLSFEPSSQFDLKSGEQKQLLDAPLPLAIKLRRALFGCVTWPILASLPYFLFNRVLVLRARLKTGDARKAQGLLWHNVEKKS